MGVKGWNSLKYKRLGESAGGGYSILKKQRELRTIKKRSLCLAFCGPLRRM